MKKSRKTKPKWLDRVLSFLMVLALVISMAPILPGNTTEAKAAGTETNITIHFMLPDAWNWSKPAIQYWGGTATVSGDTNSGVGTEVPNWGGAQAYFFSEGTDDGVNTEYTITLKGSFTGFQMLDFDHTSNTINPAYDAKLTQYKEDTPTDVFYIQKNGSWGYYTDATASTPIPELPASDPTFLLTGGKAGGGDFPGVPTWNAGAEPNFVKESGTTYTLTVNNIPVGNYEYKVLQDSAVQGWNKPWGPDGNNRTLSLSAPANVTFSLDASDASKALNVTSVYIEDLEITAPSQAKKAQGTELPATGTYYPGDGSKTEGVAVSYVAVSEGVSVNGTTLTVPSSYNGTEVTVRASYNGVSKDITIPVVEKLYNYTIYYYDFDATHMSTDAADLWIWQKSGAGASAGTPFTGTEKLSDGNTWLKAEVTLPYTDVQIIPRSAGGWSWQKEKILYNNTTEAENTTIYLVSNSAEAYTEMPQLVTPRERYVLIEYDRPAGDYTGWNIYTWNSGFGSEVTIPVVELGGKMVAKIPVKDSTADLMLSFCMRRSENGSAWAEKDGGDHYINVPANQLVVKAKFVQGEGITEVLPYNTGYAMDGANGRIHFYYRDDTLSANNDLASLEGKVKITINGTDYDMIYNAEEDRFIYDLSDIMPGDYYYYYTVDGEKLLDAFNSETGSYDGEECSKCTYQKYEMTISAELSQPTMDYNDNNVLSIKYNPVDGLSMENFEVLSATVDLSALGLSSKQAINPQLMELSIACRDNVTPGEKKLPVTVTDEYGNVYTTDATVTVTARNKSDGDFDWDEAVIYFTVTDRFFDGDAANNDAYGVGDYNTGADGGSSYHGGDFAGLNAKLDYLQDLGVNTIWITPIVENITEDQPDSATGFSTYGYHGYWASDFTEINKHLGTKEEFKALLDAAHSRNMKIMVDVVLNHAGYGTEDYFNSILTAEDGSAVKMIRDSGNTVSGDDKLDALAGLPDFATENEAVRNQLIEWQTDWMDEFDIDYYRVDTVKHVDSTTWAAFKNSLTKVNPDFKMIGEYAGAGYANTAGELGTGSMDALLDFDFNGWAKDFVTGNISEIEQNLQKRNNVINNTATMGSFLGSHDEDSLQYTLIHESGVSETEAYNLMKVAATLQITAKGQPVIYYGEEIGQAGANNWPYQTNRRDFDWAELEKQKSDSNSMYNHYKTMLAIRNDFSTVFAKGDRTTVLQSDVDGYEVISRSYGADTLYIGMNIKENAKTVVIPVNAKAGTVLTNLYDGKKYTVSADKTVSITIPAAKNGGTIVLTDKKDSIQEIPVSGNDFSKVIDAIETAGNGTTVNVKVSDVTTVPAEVFQTISGKDVTICFQINENVSWAVNGSSVKDVPAAIDLGVTVGSSSIPANKIKKLAGNNTILELSLAHDGVFGFDAELTLSVGTENVGKYANLYYYNEETGNLEYMQYCKVDADGKVCFDFAHASDYVIVFSDSVINAEIRWENETTVSNETTTTSEGTTQASGENASSAVQTAGTPKTGDSSFIEFYILLFFACGMAAAALIRKRRMA